MRPDSSPVCGGALRITILIDVISSLLITPIRDSRVALVKRYLRRASAKTSYNPSDSITALATPIYTLFTELR